MFSTGFLMLYLEGCSSLQKFFSKRENLYLALETMGPIDRTIANIAPRQFFGDNLTRPHQILLEKRNLKLNERSRQPEEKVPLVVVGGGVSGLFTSYLLRAYKPIILEQDPRFGGNSKGHSWQGIDYSIGAAYFTELGEDDPLQKLYSEIGLDKVYTVKDTQDPVALGGNIYNNFWEGQTSPSHRVQFETLKTYFTNMLDGKDGLIYPDIPITDPDMGRYIKSLDQVNFRKHLEKIAGGSLHPHIATAIEYYCWSSFAASSSEISAAAGLNFYASEFGSLYIMPGGNSGAAEHILKKLMKSLPGSHFRPKSVVFDVNVISDGVVVSYMDEFDELRSIHSQAVVLSCPKFVVSHILQGIESDRLQAIRRLKYRGYLVGNVLLKTSLAPSFYDLFMLGDGRISEKDTKLDSKKQKITDVLYGSYTYIDPERTVLTLYRAIPYDEGSNELFRNNSYETFRDEFEEQINKTILPLLGISTKSIADIRISRWGHSIPVAEEGLIADGTCEIIRRPFRGRVFFVEQDNWMLPSFETAGYEALFWKQEIEKIL